MKNSQRSRGQLYGENGNDSQNRGAGHGTGHDSMGSDHYSGNNLNPPQRNTTAGMTSNDPVWNKLNEKKAMMRNMVNQGRNTMN
jgi:hypothetical protein